LEQRLLWGLLRETDLEVEVPERELGEMSETVVPPLTPRLAMRMRSRPRSGLVSGAPRPKEPLGTSGASCCPVASYLDILDLISPTGCWIAAWFLSGDEACVAFSRAIRSASDVVILGGSGLYINKEIIR
jgi:hypothetical protein